jgi:hypothetical protein
MTTEFQSFSELYPGRFLKADLFNGQPCTYSIVNIWREEIEGDKGKEAKVLVSFKETPLQLVLAKVNAEAIKAMFGPSVPNWVGKRIKFYGTTTIMPFRSVRMSHASASTAALTSDAEVRSEWTPPRRKPVVQILKPTASEIVAKALAAAAKATTPAAAKAVEDRATALQAQGQITEAELEAILRALPAPAPEPEPDLSLNLNLSLNLSLSLSSSTRTTSRPWPRRSRPPQMQVRSCEALRNRVACRCDHRSGG